MPRGPQGRDYSFEDRLASLEQLFGSPFWASISTGYVDLCSPALRKAVALRAAVLYLRNPRQLAVTQDMHRSLVAFHSQHPGPPDSVEMNGREIQLDPGELARVPRCRGG